MLIAYPDNATRVAFVLLLWLNTSSISLLKHLGKYKPNSVFMQGGAAAILCYGAQNGSSHYDESLNYTACAGT